MFATPSRSKRKREESGQGSIKKTRTTSFDTENSGYCSGSEYISDSDYYSSEEEIPDMSSSDETRLGEPVVIEISSESESSASESDEEDYSTTIRRRHLLGTAGLVAAAAHSFSAPRQRFSAREPVHYQSSSRYRLDERLRQLEREQLLGAVDKRLEPYIAHSTRRRVDAERDMDELFEEDWRFQDLSEDSTGGDEEDWREENEREAAEDEEWHEERDYATTVESMDGRLPDFSSLQPFRERRKTRDRLRKLERAALKRAAFGDEGEGGRTGDVFGDSYNLESLFSRDHSLSFSNRSVGVAALAHPPPALLEERRRRERAASAMAWGDGEGMAGYRKLRERLDMPKQREKQMGSSLLEVQRRVMEYRKAEQERGELIEKSKRELQERAREENERRRVAAEAQAERKARIAAAERRKHLKFTAEERKHLAFALHTAPKSKPIVKGFGTTLTRNDFERMRDGQWLNDEIVNFYFELLKERQARDGFVGAQCHFFNTFFYPLLTSGPQKYNYKRVQKWTRRVDIFSLDKVIIPIHLDVHWCLAVINFQDRRFEYYDSLGATNPACLRAMRRYLEDEALDKGKSVDISTWTDYQPRDIPKQKNSWDCGVFACKYADCASRNEPFRFAQRDMNYYRRRIALDVILKIVPNSD